MEVLKQRLLIIWAQYWLHHILQKAVELGLGLLIVGGAATIVATVTPIYHKHPEPQPTPHVVVAASKPKRQHASAPPVSQTSPRPATATPVSQPAAQPSKAVPTPQPLSASQPSPGSGVKQLVPTATPGSSSSTPTSTGSTSTSNPVSTTSSTTTAPPSATGGYYSTNWSGYAALNGTFTTVSGAWTVPSVSGNGTDTTGDAAWIGIGGVSSGDLIQTGTEDTVTAAGTASTFAFYELLPDPSLEIKSLKVHTGDAMAATITETTGSQWSISITDNTTGQNYTTSVSYTSANSSAEWIEEDPSYMNGSLVPFDSFDHVVFSGGSTTQNGALVSIAGSSAAPITLVDNSTSKPIVTPSVLINSGSGFWATHD